MKPCFIELERSKFQRCAFPECIGDAVSQEEAHMKDGTAYYLGACGREGHLEQVQKAQALLVSGIPPKKLHKKKELNIEELFIQPVGKEQKCKLAQWEAYVANPVAETPPPQPKPQAQRRNTATKPEVIPVCAEWAWVERFEWWMQADGKTVRLSRLSPAEFVAAVLAIRDANFARVTVRIAWTKELVSPGVTYSYPEEGLTVGYKSAGLKLDEFKEEAEERGLL